MNGWKLFTTKYVLRVVEVKSEAEALGARLAAELESQKSFVGGDTANPGVAVKRLVERPAERPVERLLEGPLSLRIPGCRLNHREPVAMGML